MKRQGYRAGLDFPLWNTGGCPGEGKEGEMSSAVLKSHVVGV